MDRSPRSRGETSARRYVLSDDGQTAWYVSRAGHVIRVDTATTVPTNMLPPAPELSIVAEPVAPTGSAVSGFFKAVMSTFSLSYKTALLSPFGADLPIAY